jgi:hypothetical protein
MSPSVVTTPNRTAKATRAIRRQASTPPCTTALAELQVLVNLVDDVHGREVAQEERRDDERAELVASDLDRLQQGPVVRLYKQDGVDDPHPPRDVLRSAFRAKTQHRDHSQPIF